MQNLLVPIPDISAGRNKQWASVLPRCIRISEAAWA